MGTNTVAKKKAGQDTDEKRQRMRQAVAERHRAATPKGEATDEVDQIEYKRGSASDRTVRAPAGRSASGDSRRVVSA
jgi:hypothetical protein